MLYSTAKNKDFVLGDFVKIDIQSSVRYNTEVMVENGRTGRITYVGRNFYSQEPFYLVDITGGWYIQGRDLKPSTKEQHKYAKLILS